MFKNFVIEATPSVNNTKQFFQFQCFIVTYEYFMPLRYFRSLNILDGRAELQAVNSLIDPAKANVNLAQKTPN